MRQKHHATAWNQIDQALAQERIHHAWLICGTLGSGRRSFAEQLATCLLFSPQEQETGLKRIRAGQMQDCLTLSFARSNQEKKTVISIDEVRHACRFLTFHGGERDRRVLIIDSLDDLSHSSPQVLLKSIEEPAAGKTILMICRHPRRLLPALRSRCQVLTLGTPGKEALFEALNEAGHHDAKPSQLEVAWWLSAGKLHEGMAWVLHPELLTHFDRMMTWFQEPGRILQKEGLQELQDMTSFWKSIEGKQPVYLARGCLSLYIHALQCVLSSACSSYYLKHDEPQQIHAWIGKVHDRLHSIAEHLWPDFVANFLSRLGRANSRLQLPLAACLIDSFSALDTPHQLCAPFVPGQGR